MEDLDYRVSAKGMLGSSMLDAGFGQFRTITQYVCWKRGKFFGVVDARGTSQEYPECKGEVKKDLSVRVHDCPHCGYKTDRDVASGQVIRNRGIEQINSAGLADKETACAVDLPGVGENQPRQVAQSPELRQAQLPRSRRGVTRKSSK